MQRVIGIKRILSLIKVNSTMVFAASIPVLRGGTEAIRIVRTELARFPVRAFSPISS